MFLIAALAGCTTSTVTAEDTKPSAADGTASASASGAASGSGSGTPLADAITDIPAATESRDGYDRDEFNHWIDGDRVIRSHNLGHAVSLPDTLRGHVHIV
jgi:hypothetical protein